MEGIGNGVNLGGGMERWWIWKHLGVLSPL